MRVGDCARAHAGRRLIETFAWSDAKRQVALTGMTVDSL